MDSDTVAGNMNSILQIHLDEVNSEKKEVASYREIHHEKITSFRGKIFASAAVIATFLAAVMALNTKELVNRDASLFITQHFFVFLILLVVDIIIILLAEIFFAKHILITRISWFELENEYTSMIHHIDKIRISLSTNTINVDQPCILISYTSVSLANNRREIINKIKELSKNIIAADDIKDMLSHPCNRQKEILEEAITMYFEDKYELENQQQNGILVGLPSVTCDVSLGVPCCNLKDKNRIQFIKSIVKLLNPWVLIGALSTIIIILVLGFLVGFMNIW